MGALPGNKINDKDLKKLYENSVKNMSEFGYGVETIVELDEEKG